MAFFNPNAPLTIHRGKLPHWRQESAIYFVTFRLADSLPKDKWEWLRREKELWIKLNPEPHNGRQQVEFYQRFTETIDRWLNAGYGSCILARPDCKAIMESSLRHFDGERYELGEFSVMPNHVHAIVAVIGGHQLAPFCIPGNRSPHISSIVCLFRRGLSGTLKASITSFGARGIWQKLRLIFVITEGHVGKASRLTSSEAGTGE
jgi:hypothetical protein